MKKNVFLFVFALIISAQQPLWAKKLDDCFLLAYCSGLLGDVSVLNAAVDRLISEMPTTPLTRRYVLSALSLIARSSSSEKFVGHVPILFECFKKLVRSDPAVPVAGVSECIRMSFAYNKALFEDLITSDLLLFEDKVLILNQILMRYVEGIYAESLDVDGLVFLVRLGACPVFKAIPEGSKALVQSAVDLAERAAHYDASDVMRAWMSSVYRAAVLRRSVLRR